VHRWSILIIVQRDATQSSLFIILRARSTCFGCQPHPSSRVHKTVTTASGTGHNFCAVVTVLCTLDDGCGWHPKHVEWTCRIINRLICVVSRWTIINIHYIYRGVLHTNVWRSGMTFFLMPLSPLFQKYIEFSNIEFKHTDLIFQLGHFLWVRAIFCLHCVCALIGKDFLSLSPLTSHTSIQSCQL